MTNGQNNGPSAKRVRRDKRTVIRTKRNRSVTRSGNSGSRNRSVTRSGMSGSRNRSVTRSGMSGARSGNSGREASSMHVGLGYELEDMLRHREQNSYVRRMKDSTNNFVLGSKLNPKLTGPQRALALAIVHGDLRNVRERIGAGIPDSYFKEGFDTKGRKLVAFAAHVALKFGMDDDHVKIFDEIVQKADIGHVKACTKGNKGRCLVHNVTEGATTIEHVNTVRNIIHRRFGNEGRNAWSTMSLRRTKSGHLPGNRGVPAVREHVRGGGAVGNKYSHLSSEQKRNVQKLINEMLKSSMIH